MLLSTWLAVPIAGCHPEGASAGAPIAAGDPGKADDAQASLEGCQLVPEKHRDGCALLTRLFFLDRAALGVRPSWKGDPGEESAGVVLNLVPLVGNDARDQTQAPLIEGVEPGILARPSFQAFVPLLDNYAANPTLGEQGHPAEKLTERQAEIRRFLTAVQGSALWPELHRYLIAKHGVPEDPGEFLSLVERIWFGFFGAGRDLSGFEHVFVGEIEDNATGSVRGYHNWVKYYLDQQAGRINTLGRRAARLTPDGVSASFAWTAPGTQRGYVKNTGSILIGSSPELELAMGTLAFFEGGAVFHTSADVSWKLEVVLDEAGEHLRTVYPVPVFGDILERLWRLDRQEEGIAPSLFGSPGSVSAPIAVDPQQPVPEALSDAAPRPLFQRVDERILERETYRRLVALLDNYSASPLLGERRYPTERLDEFASEQSAFLDAVLATRVMQEARRYLVEQRQVPPEPAAFRSLLTRIWFDFFKAKQDLSGFESVFVGETEERDNGRIGGLHSWVKFYLDERAGRADYLGHRMAAPSADVLTFAHTWTVPETKKVYRKTSGGFLVGTSPQLELAMGTIAFFEDGGRLALPGITYEISVAGSEDYQHLRTLDPVPAPAP